MDTADVAAALDVFAATPATLRALLSPLPEDVTSAPADGDWSPRDVVAHLASLDPLTMVGRVRAIVEEDGPVLAEINENDVLDRSGLRAATLGDVLGYMERVRAEALPWLRGLTAEQLVRTGRHLGVGELSAEAIINHKGWHDLAHIQQVCRMLSVPLDAGSGSMRRYH